MLLTDRQVITELACGARIVATDEGDGYSYKLIREQVAITAAQVIRLLDEGWIYSSNTAYFLTDEGKKSYLRSTDELGNGQLLAPKPRTGESLSKGEGK